MVKINLYKLQRSWFHFKKMWTRFYQHGGPMMAAAISFYFILSSVPLTLLGFSILGMILGSPQRATAWMLAITNLQKLFPAGTMPMASFFETFVSKAQFVSILSFVLLFVFSGGVFLTVESAINRVFERRENRPIWRQLLFAYILMFTTYLFLIGSVAMSWGAIIAAGLGTSVLGIPSARMGFLWEIFWFLTPIILVAFFFALVYKIIPHRKVRWKDALVGGFFAGIGWEIAKRLFTIYIRYVVRFNELYGGISVVLATLMWIFYTAAILLLGGELVMNIIHEREKDEVLL